MEGQPEPDARAALGALLASGTPVPDVGRALRIMGGTPY